MIEWDTTQFYIPQTYGFHDYCHDHAIPCDGHLPSFFVIIGDEELDSLKKFLAHDTSREHAGILVGVPFFDPFASQFFVAIHGVINAPYSQGSSTHLQFTAGDWSYFAAVMDEKYPGNLIIGWFHSHPGLGVFMSTIDQSTQAAFFNNPWNIAIVVDPVRNHTGWFLGGNCILIAPQQIVTFSGKKLEPLLNTSRGHTALPQCNSFCAQGLIPSVILLSFIWFLLRDSKAQ